MKLDSNFSGFSVNSASFNNQVDGNAGSQTSAASGAPKRVCCGRGCCSQGRQKISLDNLSTLLKATSDTSSSTADSQNSTQVKPKHHGHHGGHHVDLDQDSQSTASTKKPQTDADFEALFKQLDASSATSGSSATADSQNAVQEKPRSYGHHSRHHADFDANKVAQNTVTAQAV